MSFPVTRRVFPGLFSPSLLRADSKSCTTKLPRRLAALAMLAGGFIVPLASSPAATVGLAHQLRVAAPRGYLPGIPVLVRVELHDGTNGVDRSVWNAEATLAANPPSVTLSTNRVTLRNGLGSALVLCSNGGDFQLNVTLGPLSTNAPLQTLTSLPVTLVGGTLPGASTVWSGVIRVTNDVTVPTGHTLTILSNTLVLMNGVASGTVAPDLLVSGAVQSLGTEQYPVTITCADAALRWGQIRHNSAQPSLYRFTSITRAGRAPGEGHTGQAPVIRPSSSTIVFENCNITDHADGVRGSATFGQPGKIMSGISSDLTFRNCLLARARMGPEIQGTALLCTNTWIMEMRGPDDSDGFYIHAQSAGQQCAFKRCVLAAGEDDGLDTLDSIVNVEDCIIRDWNNLFEDAKGISVFNGATHLRRSLVVDCTVGVAAKWSGGATTLVTLNQSTVTGNLTNVIAAYKANAPGPFIDFRITNCVLWGGNSVHSDFAETNFTIVYSSLGEPWAGAGNIETDPQFVDATAHDYRLLPGSPCINTGDPVSPLDPDGSRADMGAFPFNSAANPAVQVAIGSPASGAFFSTPANMVIEVSATASPGSVARVDFFANGVALGSDTNAPFSLTWSNAPLGNYLLTALATDTGGLKATSAPVSVTVVNDVLVPAHPTGVMISEIMYHPASENPLEEYLELFNGGPTNVNLQGWRLSSGVQFDFPNVTLPVGGFLVVAAHVPAFTGKYPGVTNVLGGWTGQLSNTRESIDLENASARQIDTVRYADEGDWAVRQRGLPSPLPANIFRGWQWLKEPDGGGKSLEVINPAMPNQHGQNWAASLVNEGTPGRSNSVARANLAPLIVEPKHRPVIPRPTDPVTITARIVDERASNVAVTLHFRNDSLAPPEFSVTSMLDDGLHGDGVARDGIFGAVLPARPHATVVEFYLRAQDQDGNARTWPAPAIETNGDVLGQAANALYQVDTNEYAGDQPIYRLIMTAGEWQELWTIQHGNYAIWPSAPGTSQSEAQMNGTFVSVDGTGTECRYTVGIKNRGHGTRNRQPNNFRLNFSSDQPWKDVIALNLNGQYSHAQIFGAAIAQKSGVAGADSRAVQLRVNSTNLALLDNFTRTYGSYAANEVLNADWAENHYPLDSGGNIYRAIRDIAPSEMNYRGDAKTGYTNTYFKTSNESEDDWTDLAALLRVIGTNDLFSVSKVQQVVNVDQWMRHLALMALFANQETGLNTGYNDDYSMYRAMQDRRTQLLYYDLDSILSEGGGPLVTNSTLLGFLNNNGAGQTFNRLFAVPEFRQRYFQTLQQFIDSTFSSPQFDSLLQQTLGSYVPSATIQRMTNWMNGRRAYALSVLANNLLPITNLPVATIAGGPRSPTPFTTATLTVGGSNVVAYRFRLNSASYGAETPVAQPITLTGLAQGSTNTVFVLAKDTAGLWQDAALPTVSRTWVVDTNVPAVRLNEVLARNVSAVNQAGTSPDLVELFNEGFSAVDLGGLRLSDDANAPDKFTIPAGTTLAAGVYLVLIAANADGSPGLHLGFNLNQAGEGVFLFNRASSGGALLDSVSFGPQLADRSIGRLGADGGWVLTVPTFGSANLAVSLGNPANLRINEWLASGFSPYADDFVELFNLDPQPVDLGGLGLTDEPFSTPGRHRIAPLSFIDGGGHLAFIADGNAAAGPDHLGFQLAAEQGQLAINRADLSVIDCVVYGPQRTDVSQGRCPDGAWKIASLAVATPGAPNVCPAEPVAPILISLAAFTNSWRYNQGGTNLGSAWKDTGYDDSAWPAGRGVLGFDGNNALVQSLTNTILSLTNAAGGTNVTFYFRTRFQFPAGATPSSFVFTNAFDDGAMVYLNGNEIFRQNMPTGAVSYATTASANAEISTFTQNTFAGAGLAVVSGENVLAVEIHQSTQNPPTDVVMGQALTAVIVTNTPGQAAVVLNEVLANNSSLADPDGSTPDWVEIYNPSAAPVDLGDMSLTDSQVTPRRWIFPPNSVVPPRGWFAVRCDADRPASETNTGFGLKANGDTLFLYNKPADGGTERDRVSFGLQIADLSIGRVSDGSSNWNLTLPSIGAANLPAPLGDVMLVKVNEWMAHPESGNDWFELFNPGSLPVALGRLWLTDNLLDHAKSQIPALSFLGAASTNGYVKFICDSQPGADHVNFALKTGGEALGLFTTNGIMIDGVTFAAQQSGVSQGRLADGATNIVSFFTNPTPGNANYLPLDTVVINEVLAHTDLPLEDAIELHNPTAAPIDISGWWLSDANDTPRKYQIPPGTILSAGGFAVFYEYQFNAVDQADIPFALSSAKGDEVHLSETTAGNTLTGRRAIARFGPSANGVSFGRFATTVGVDFPPMSRHSFGIDNPLTVAGFRLGTGRTNACPQVGPIIISEIMYHPPDLGTNDNVVEEFVELHNISTNTVAFYDPAYPTNAWRLRDAVDFEFPTNMSLAPGGYLLVVSFDPVTNLSALAVFQSRYGSNLPLTGPYRGKLDNSDEPVELEQPDAPQLLPGPDFGLVPFVLVERVRYSDRGAWPTNADGWGSSLQRRQLAGYGNEPTNWIANAPTPGGDGGLDSDGDLMPDDWEMAHGLDPFNPADATADTDGDGQSNVNEFLSGTNPLLATSVLRVETIVAATGGVTLQFDAMADQAYSIEWKASLADTGWTRLLFVPSSATAHRVTAFDDSALTAGQRFYRIVTPATP